MSAHAQTLLARGRADDVAALHPLPSPRGVALEIMRLAQREDVSIAEVARLAQSDPALAGRLIKAANSPALGARRPTASLQEAILRLGLPMVKSLAAAFSLVNDYRSGACPAFDYRRFWLESLLRGLAAEALAARLRIAAPEEAFCCGLLGQIGRLGLATAHAERYARALEAAGGDENECLREEERRRFALDHAELTVALLEDWGFPRPLAQAVEAHFDLRRARLEEASRVARLARLVELAQHIARAGAAGPEAKRMLSNGALLAAAQLGVDSDGLQALADEIQRHATGWAGLLGVPVPDGPLLALPANGAAPEGAPREAAASEARLRILIAAPDALAARMKNVLEDAGHEAVLARDEDDALARIADAPPQVVIADLAAAGGRGLALVRALRATRAGRRLHVLALTGGGAEEHAVEALEAGADDFLAVPFAPRVLLARLRAGLRVIRQQEALAHDVEAIRQFAAELAVNNRRLQQAALTDPLTGLPNRRYALDRLEQECALARRRRSPIACLAVDADYFKRVNDEHGHETGDAVLAHVATLMRGVARLQDAVCRVGGEEFLVILPDSSAREATILAERLRSAIAAQPYRCADGSALPLSISVGVAAEDVCNSTPADLLRRADEALYAAKRGGRNRTSGPGRD
jgi:diguanylate cyclase (GGDEF)-like protein